MSLRCFTGSLPIKQFDFSKRWQHKTALNQKNRQIDWQPFPDSPQLIAYNSEADEIFYGGAAGGGKTDLGLGKAGTKHRRVLALRREYPQLNGIVERSQELYSEVASYNDSKHIWRFNDGRTIQFGSCQHEPDKKKYQGQPHDLVWFDEASEFLESQVLFIGAWARSENPKQKVQVLLTGNPPLSADGYWVLQRYAPWLDPHHPNPAKPGELRWYVRLDGVDTPVDGPEPVPDSKGKLQTPKSRTFIFAKVQDNPIYMANGYEATLQSLPEPLRSMMLEGNFQAGQEDDPLQVIPTAWILIAQQRWVEQEHREHCALSALGVDIAHGGKDNTIIQPRYGSFFAKPKVHPGTTTPSGPIAAALVLRESVPGIAINIDMSVWGSSAYEVLLNNPQLPNSCFVNGINFAEGSKATDKTGKLRFANKRAECYWAFREALDPDSGQDIALPPDSQIVADLTAPHWSLRSNGILIESKEDIKKRLQRSTDWGDAIVMAWAYSGQGLSITTGSRKREASTLGSI